MEKKKIKLGSIHPTRDFSYVTDTANAFIEIAQCEASIGKTINFGSNFEISIGKTAELISQIMGIEIDIVSDDKRFRPKNSEVERLFADTTLAKKILSLQPEHSGLEGFKKGLEKTIHWYTKPENLKHFKSNIYNT